MFFWQPRYELKKGNGYATYLFINIVEKISKISHAKKNLIDDHDRSKSNSKFNFQKP